MRQLPGTMEAEIGAALSDAQGSLNQAKLTLTNPKPRKPEVLEDALNALQDAGYRARRAYRPQDVVDGTVGE